MTIDYGQANLSVSSALIDQLAENGVAHAIVCPGSRSTPLAVALAAHPAVRVRVLVDERSAAFFALGMARQLAAPVALLSTSGTAAANFLPAVAEASLSRIPLVVLTADRPPELRGWGAAQTIVQPRLFGSHVLWAADLPVPNGDVALIRHARAVANRAATIATGPPQGPVHLNIPFREPLLPGRECDNQQLFAEGRLSNRHRRSPRHLTLDATAADDIADVVARSPRGIIVCGPDASAGEALASAVTALSKAAGYPILADPLSGIRFGKHDHARMIDAYDLFLRERSVADNLAPDLVIRVGAIPTSKPLQQFMSAKPGMVHLLFDPGSPRDPAHLATEWHQVEPTEALARVASARARLTGPPDTAWLHCWKSTDAATGTAVSDALQSLDELSEPRAIAELTAMLPSPAVLVVGNSMPVRDADAFARGDCRAIRVVGNRGANGIDGLNSSALGAAAVCDAPVILIVGDLSFYHDLNGLLAARRFDISATIVVFNNDGGGIFSFLPQAELLDRTTFESLFGTPIGLDIAQSARLYGAHYERPSSWPQYRESIARALAHDGLSIVEVVTDRERNVAHHRTISARVQDAVNSMRGAGT